MAETSNISWTDATWNIWEGCTKVSPACQFCYAERDRDHRLGVVQWGPMGTRKASSLSTRRLPFRLQRKAEAAGRPLRVFVNSLSDFFEDWSGAVMDHNKQQLFIDLKGQWVLNPPGRTLALSDLRTSAFSTMEELPGLHFLLLTKRPQNIRKMVPAHWLDQWPAHVWIGTSTENQECADKRLPYLLDVPAKIRFISAEPLLSELKLSLEGIHWVIGGGESGPHARPTHPDWARTLRDQCLEASVPFHWKQHGEWLPLNDYSFFELGDVDQYQLMMLFRNGVDSDTIPRGERRVYAAQHGLPVSIMRVGKRLAGRLLDDQEWNAFPVTT